MAIQKKDISNAFNKLKIITDERKIDDVSDETLSLSKPKILNAIDQIKQKKKRPDLNTIYEYLSKIEASNTAKLLIEAILTNLVATNVIANRKTPKGFDWFQKLEVAEALVHALDTYAKQANITSNAETQTELPKRYWFSLVTRETETKGKSMLDVMTQTDRIYSSNPNGDTAQECKNIDMIKLLKDETAFLRDELCRELRSNQKTMEVLLAQHSHYQTHQKKCDEFQYNNENQSTSYKNSQNRCTQSDPPNSYTRQSSKSLLKHANTTNIHISIEKENTTLQALTGNGKENSKYIKTKEKIILAGDSIESGIN